MRKKVILYVQEQEHLVSTSAHVFITSTQSVENRTPRGVEISR